MRRAIAAVLLAAGVLGCSAAAQGHEPARIKYTTSDGVTIVGDYWTPIDMDHKAPVVILLHMYRSNRHAFEPLVPALEQAGFAILTIDLRGHGESIEPESRMLPKKVRDRDAALFRAMYRDVAGAYNWLQQRPEVDLSRLAIVGASVGCSAALDYAGRDRSVDVLALMTPGKDYLGLDSTAHIKKYLQRPVLMLSSEEERSAGTDLLASLAPGTEVQIYTQTDIHGTDMFGKVKGVEQRVADFLKSHVGGASTEVVHASVKSNVYHQSGSRVALQIKKDNLRIFSSAAEARSRGLRASKR